MRDYSDNVLTILRKQGGHYMRPDLIRLLVDKTPKTYIVDANAADPITFPSTLERLGLGKALPVAEE
jgi:cyanide hydratase